MSPCHCESAEPEANSAACQVMCVAQVLCQLPQASLQLPNPAPAAAHAMEVAAAAALATASQLLRFRAQEHQTGPPEAAVTARSVQPLLQLLHGAC